MDKDKTTKTMEQASDLGEEMSMEKMFAEQEDFQKKLLGRQIVNVKAVQVGNDFVFVDIGEKKEGIIPLTDFSADKIPAAGAEICAVIEKRGSNERHTVLSHKKALEMQGWENCKKHFEEKTVIRGTILEHVKGGYIVDIEGAQGFMPLSLSELHPAYKHHLPVNAKIKCQLTEFAREKRRVIVSRKQVLADEEAARREKVLSEIKKGDNLRVVVSKTVKDKLFVRFHGIEGIVHLEDVAWREPEKMLSSMKRGQRLKAKLLDIGSASPSLRFGLKQLYPNPADLLRRKYPHRSVVKGEIKEVSDNGIKVSISPIAEGFVSSADYGGDTEYKVGDKVGCVVLGVNAKEFTLNLSIKFYEQAQNKKIVAHYLKETPRLTLGQLLSNSEEAE